MILLFAAALLAVAEAVSLSLLLREMGEQQASRVRTASEHAATLLPKIAEWIRQDDLMPGAAAQPLVVPFELSMIDDDARSPLVTNDVRQRLEGGELVVVSQISEPELSVLGLVRTASGSKVFRLTDSSSTVLGFATGRTLIAQHALILLAALISFSLVGFAREGPSAEGLPAVRAYEEAMSRLRVRDDERRAAFDREKTALNSVLRDREAMARAGELTAGIVHEVRNSLGTIAAQAKFAEASSDPRAKQGALAIAEEVSTLQSVMSRFLDFIRTEEVHFVRFDLGRMVSRAVGREQASLHTEVTVDGPDTMVTGDEDLLERAIENVIRNACQAAGAGGQVWVKFGADSTHAFVIVDDNGPGIRNPERALRPFESERAGGLGLGLPLTLKILSLHHGTLDLGRRPEGGTQTLCRWPRIESDATTGNVIEAVDPPNP